MLDTCNKVIEVQSLVERPEIYILASYDDTVAEKLTYIEARRDDLLELPTPITIGEVKIYDTMSFFQGICKFKIKFNLMEIKEMSFQV